MFQLRILEQSTSKQDVSRATFQRSQSQNFHPSIRTPKNHKMQEMRKDNSRTENADHKKRKTRLTKRNL